MYRKSYWEGLPSSRDQRKKRRLKGNNIRKRWEREEIISLKRNEQIIEEVRKILEESLNTVILYYEKYWDLTYCRKETRKKGVEDFLRR